MDATVEVCSICRHKMRSDEEELKRLKKLECDHIFHLHCIMKMHDYRCPMCMNVSSLLKGDGSVKKRKKAAVREAREKQIEEDEELARQLQEEEIDNVPPPPPQDPQDLERDSDEWNGAVQSIVLYLAEMMGHEDHHLNGLHDLEAKKNALHNVFHNHGSFLNVTCASLRDVAGAALDHEMFRYLDDDDNDSEED